MKLHTPSPRRLLGAISALIAGATAAPLVLTASPARATTVLKVDVATMVRLSDWVVRARVLAVSPVDLRDAKQRGADRLFTDVQLEVLEAYHGEEVPTRYTMRLMGGVGKDGLAMTIPGMPTFAPGEEVVLFLEPSRDGHLPAGLMQGVWRVIRSPIGPPVVQQFTGGMLMMQPGPSGGLVADEGAHAQPFQHRLLSSLAQEVRAASSR